MVRDGGKISPVARITPRQLINCVNWAETCEFSSKLEVRIRFPAQRTVMWLNWEDAEGF